MATLIKLTRIAQSIKPEIRQRDWNLVVVFKTAQVRFLLHNGAARLIRDWPEAIVDSWQIDPKTGGANISTPTHRQCASGERDLPKESERDHRHGVKIIISHDVMAQTSDSDATC